MTSIYIKSEYVDTEPYIVKRHGHLQVKQRLLEHILPLELSERTNADEVVNLDFQPVEL